MEILKTLAGFAAGMIVGGILGIGLFHIFVMLRDLN